MVPPSRTSGGNAYGCVIPPVLFTLLEALMVLSFSRYALHHSESKGHPCVIASTKKRCNSALCTWQALNPHQDIVAMNVL